MKFTIEISDTTQGVRLQMTGGSSGVTDHQSDSLSAMWASKIYMQFEEAKTKGFAKVLIHEEHPAVH